MCQEASVQVQVAMKRDVPTAMEVACKYSHGLEKPLQVEGIAVIRRHGCRRNDVLPQQSLSSFRWT